MAFLLDLLVLPLPEGQSRPNLAPARRKQRILEALSRHLVRVGRFGDAVDAAMIAVHAEPLRESAQRALVEVYRAEGNVVEARYYSGGMAAARGE